MEPDEHEPGDHRPHDHDPDNFKIPCKAIVSYSANDWRFQDVLVREPREHELLVKIVGSGICHTDVQGVGGLYPHIFGHEGSSATFKICVFHDGGRIARAPLSNIGTRP